MLSAKKIASVALMHNREWLVRSYMGASRSPATLAHDLLRQTTTTYDFVPSTVADVEFRRALCFTGTLLAPTHFQISLIAVRRSHSEAASIGDLFTGLCPCYAHNCRPKP
jgi:hypothetical protein